MKGFSAMEQWEYLPTYLKAEATSKDIKAFLKSQTPDQKRFPKYTAQAMIPELNEMGDQGWELVHMEPVPDVGKKGDVRLGGSTWSNVYFCVFKRRKAIPTVMPLNANGQPAFPAQQTPPVQHTPPSQPAIQQTPTIQPPAQPAETSGD